MSLHVGFYLFVISKCMKCNSIVKLWCRCNTKHIISFFILDRCSYKVLFQTSIFNLVHEILGCHVSYECMNHFVFLFQNFLQHWRWTMDGKLFI